MKEAVKDFAVHSCKDSRGEITVEKDCMSFRNGSRLYFASCNVYIASLSNIRGITSGRTPTFMIFDECGYFTKDQWGFVFNTVCENPCKSLFISSVYKNMGDVPLCFNTGFLGKKESSLITSASITFKQKSCPCKIFCCNWHIFCYSVESSSKDSSSNPSG